MIARLAACAALSIALVSPQSAVADTTKPDAAPKKSPEGRLSEGRVAYERGDYAAAVKTIIPLLYPSVELSTEEAVIEAHRLLVLSYFLQKKEAEAEEEATSILALRPSFQLDSMIDPSAAVSFFEGVRKRQGERLKEAKERERKLAEERAREEERRRKAQAERIYMERTVEKRSRFIATVPFGVGQWQNGQKWKAALFASGELAFGLLSASTYLALERKYPVDPTTGNRLHPFDEQGLAQGLSWLQVGSGIAFWGLLAWGIIDAHVLFKREVVVKERELPRAPAPRVQLSPSSGPGLVGLGLQGAF